MTAFCQFGRPQRLEHCTPAGLSAFSTTCCMTRGISAIYERNRAGDPAASGAGKCGALLATVLCALHNALRVQISIFPTMMAGTLPASNLSLPDGRLRVGTEVPLLARRYRYLSLLGEGRSAQVSSSQLQQCPNRTHQHKVPTAYGDIRIPSRLGTCCSLVPGTSQTV